MARGRTARRIVVRGQQIECRLMLTVRLILSLTLMSTLRYCAVLVTSTYKSYNYYRVFYSTSLTYRGAGANAKCFQ